MVQALCNCAQTLEHRGPAQFTYQDPSIGLYPGLRPPAGVVEPYRPRDAGFPPVVPGQITIEMPAWNPMSWSNLPFIDVAESPGGSNPFLPTPGSFNPASTPWAPQPSVSMPGSVETGPINAGGPVTAPEVYTEEIHNYGDTYNEGDTYNAGDMFVEGNTYNQNNVFNGGPVTNQGPVTNNNTTVNGGPVSHLSTTHMFAPVFMRGPVFVRHGPVHIGGPIVLQGQPMGRSNLSVITDVWYDPVADGIRASRATLFFLGDHVLQIDKEVC